MRHYVRVNSAPINPIAPERRGLALAKGFTISECIDGWSVTGPRDRFDGRTRPKRFATEDEAWKQAARRAEALVKRREPGK